MYIENTLPSILLVGASFGALSIGRFNITWICSSFLSLAVVIALRYCAIRKQFGPSENEEWPVIEYQVQVYCLYKYKYL